MRIFAALLVLGLPLCAQEKVDFTKQIAPILVQRCIECHGAEEQEGDLRLDAKAHVFVEGDEDFWTIAPKDSGDSELLRRLGLGLDDDELMPARGEPLTKEQQELLLLAPVAEQRLVLGRRRQGRAAGSEFHP